MNERAAPCSRCGRRAISQAMAARPDYEARTGRDHLAASSHPRSRAKEAASFSPMRSRSASPAADSIKAVSVSFDVQSRTVRQQLSKDLTTRFPSRTRLQAELCERLSWACCSHAAAEIGIAVDVT